jgi:hypothetical protein
MNYWLKIVRFIWSIINLEEIALKRPEQSIHSNASCDNFEQIEFTSMTNKCDKTGIKAYLF